jgi:hypothetical protein
VACSRFEHMIENESRSPEPTRQPEESASPWTDTPTERLVDQVCELAARLAATTYHWLTMIAELDHRRAWADWQMASCAHWLSWRCGLGLIAARDHVRVARALTQLPRISAAFAAGKLSYSKVRAITRIAATAPHLESELLDLALASTAAQTERIVRGYRRATKTDPGPGESSTQPPEPEASCSWYWDDDGYLVLTARLNSLDGAALITALNAQLSANHPPSKPTPEPPAAEPGATEPPAAADGGVESADAALRQVSITTRAEALAAVAHTALAAGPVDTTGIDRHMVHIHLGQDILDHPEDRTENDSAESSAADQPEPTVADGLPAVLRGRCHVSAGGITAGGTALTEAMAHRLLCDTALRVWIHEANGKPLNYGRKHRLVTPAQRRLLVERDQGCAVPGCSNTRWLDAHHIVSWLRGGLTDPDNLVMLCSHHHDQVHAGKLTVIANADGTFSFRTHAGHLLTAAPTTSTDSTTPTTPADPADLIADDVQDPAQTADINPDTLGGGWNGDRLDLDATVSGLLQDRDAA